MGQGDNSLGYVALTPGYVLPGKEQQAGRDRGCGPCLLSSCLCRDANEILVLACGQADHLGNKWILIRNP